MFYLSYGGVAQLGEHLPCKQGVMSSNLTISTKQRGCIDFLDCIHLIELVRMSGCKTKKIYTDCRERANLFASAHGRRAAELRKVRVTESIVP